MASKKKGGFTKARKSTDRELQHEKKATKRLLQQHDVIEYPIAIPEGEMKDMTVEMPASFSPKFVEAAWYSWWEKQGYFTPPAEKPDVDSDPFVIVIPPPNITGHLHLGHALTNAVQDMMIRYHRMMGRDTLWVPGSDHAGIATQTVVEKKLMHEEGLTRHDIGREEFLRRTWDWKEEYGSYISGQLRILGSSLDWTREVFTMDEERSNAVSAAFVELFNRGLIYRDVRLIHWDCTLRTAISDIEAEDMVLTGITELSVPGHPKDKKYKFGIMESFAYPLADGEGEVVVATTRLETMMADAAVAIHPEDQRYVHLHGKHVRHPFHPERLLPIVLDAELVDMEFGTGCVKITPGHDENDFMVGKRHSLPFWNLLTEEGLLNEEHGGEFSGMLRYEARQAIRAAMEERGLYRGMKPNPMTIKTCYRSGDIIEPMIRPQWFMNCKDAAARSVEAVRSGDLRITPSKHERTWFQWLENIRDWCISRQLWWGHRVPAYYAKEIDVNGNEVGEDCPGSRSEISERWFCAPDEESALRLAAEKLGCDLSSLKMLQDEDVLDTWFSSGLFPFSVLGWPEKTADLERFYPTSVLETAHDILFFWVARMVMMGFELTGQLPFKDVFLHSLVRDAHGRKMSKSTGNVVDPVDVINGISLEDLQAQLQRNTNIPPAELALALEGQAADFPVGIPECGTDGMRFALAVHCPTERDSNLDVNDVVLYRNFCNKIWNAFKLTLALATSELVAMDISSDLPKPLLMRWAESRFNAVIVTQHEAMNEFKLSKGAECINAWFVNVFCDHYLEFAKMAIRSDRTSECEKALIAQSLVNFLETTFRILHPYMPFITEELWQRLHNHYSLEKPTPSIMIASYPNQEDYLFDEVVDAVASKTLQYVSEYRAFISLYKLSKHHQLTGFIQTDEPLAEDAMELIVVLANLASLEPVTEQPPATGMRCVGGSEFCYVSLSGVVDPDVEIHRLEASIVKVRGKIEKERKKMEKFNARTPAKAIEKANEKVRLLTAEMDQAMESIAQFEQLAAELS